MDTEKLFLSVKKDVRSLLISSKHGLSPEQLRKDYQKMLGHCMPLKVLGFRSVLDMVKEMPDAVRLDCTLDDTIVLKAIGDETTKGIEELVSKQRNKQPKPKGGGAGHFSKWPLHRQNTLVLPRRGHTPPPVPAQLRSQLRQLLAHGPVGLSELERFYALRFGRPLTVMNYGFYSIAEMLAAASDMLIVKQTRLGSRLMLKPEITPVRQKLNSTAALPKQFTEIPNVSVSTEKSLFSNSAPEDQNKAKHNAAIGAQEIKPDPFVMQQKSFEKSVAKLEEEFRKRILESGESGTVSRELKDKLRKVVAEHSQGMAIHNLPTVYKKTYGEDLPLTQCGFLNVTEMVGALSDMFYVQPSPKKGATDLYIMEHKPNEQPALSLNTSADGHYFSCSERAWERQDDGGESTESLEADCPIEITSKNIHQMVNILPATVWSQGSVVPLDALRCQKLKPPTRKRIRELVPVVVEKIASPSHFYVRFDEGRGSRTLENMMFEMRSCYSCPEVAKRYQLPEAYVRPGQVCCVAPGGLWFYRVVIHKLLSAAEVEVYYVDFGVLNAVSRSRLQFLKSCYAELPAQAVPCVLAEVRPIKGVWTKEATRLFQTLCYDRTLVAAIHSYQQGYLLLYLCDTHTEEDLYVHSRLQAEGHAVACAATHIPVLEQFNPVTRYLGGDRLEKVKEHSAAMKFFSAPNGQNLTAQAQRDAFKICCENSTDGVKNQQRGQEMAPLDPPELEFIDVDQRENLNPFESLPNKDPESFGYWDQGWTNAASVDEGSKHVQDGQGESAETALLSPGSFIKPGGEAQPVVESKNTQQLASSLHTLGDQAPSSTPSHSLRPDMSAELFQPLASTLMFSMFSSGKHLAQDAFFLRHTSPFALGPSARMAVRPSLLSWYT